MEVSAAFEQTYGKEPDGVSFCPYRVCPLGAHVDHNLGKITGFAIDKGISVAYAADESGKIRAASLQFDSVQEWSASDESLQKPAIGRIISAVPRRP